MAEEAHGEERTQLHFTIPTEPTSPVFRPDAARPSLGHRFNRQINNNGQCACWDRLIPALNLLEEPAIPLTEVCIYHRAYFSRRIFFHRNHSCDCHYNPDEQRCHDCGYCHSCGCDLVTTSTAYFHRCSCRFCLTRCCPQQPTDSRTDHIQRQHAFFRARQFSNRCPTGAPTSKERRLSTLLSQPDLAELESLVPRPTGIGRGAIHTSQEEVTTGVRLQVSNRWPSEDGRPGAIEQDRGSTGLWKRVKTPTPVYTNPAAFANSAFEEQASYDNTPPEANECFTSTNTIESSQAVAPTTVAVTPATAPSTVITAAQIKLEPVSEPEDDW